MDTFHSVRGGLDALDGSFLAASTLHLSGVQGVAANPEQPLAIRV